MNQVIPLEYARYVLLNPDKDPEWREHARQLIDWVKTTAKWPKYIVHGATVSTEQGNGKTYCCNQPNQCCDSHTSRLAAVEALFYAKTGDPAYKEQAFRSFNWVTYFQGMQAGAHAPFGNQWWFTDEFADGPRRLMDGLWAVPEWAPADEAHLLGSSSVVTKIAYGRGSVTYSTFDAASDRCPPTELCARFRNRRRTRLSRRTDLQAEGYTLEETHHILRIRHDQARGCRYSGRPAHRERAYYGRPPAITHRF